MIEFATDNLTLEAALLKSLQRRHATVVASATASTAVWWKRGDVFPSFRRKSAVPLRQRKRCRSKNPFEKWGIGVPLMYAAPLVSVCCAKTLTISRFF